MKGTKNERTAFLILTSAVFVYVLLRAILVPMVQDEATTFWLYARTGEFMPFDSHPDAGNHFLNSLLGSLGYQFFGPCRLGVRWGSVLAFLFYAWGVWRLVREVLSVLVRWCAALALLLCPFLLDYFSMLRGYGLGMAAWVWALWALLAFARTGSWRTQAVIALALFIGVFSDLSLLTLWPFLLALSIALWLAHRPRTHFVPFLCIIVLQIAAMVFAARIGFFLQHNGSLYLGRGSSFFNVSVYSLVGAIFGTPRMRWYLLVAAVGSTCIALAAFNAIRTRRWQSAQVLLGAVLAEEVLCREFMFHLLGTNFPENRAALHIVPLGIILFAYSVDEIGHWRWPWIWTVLLLLVFPLRTLLTLNVDRAMNNIEITTPDRFISKVRQLQGSAQRPLMLSGYGQLNECWAFQQLGQAAVPIDMRPDPKPGDQDDARVVCAWQLDALGLGYHIADSSAASGVVLLFRDRPLALTLIGDTLLPDWSGDPEFMSIDVPKPKNAPDLALAFTSDFITANEMGDVRLVIEVRDSKDNTVRYDHVDLQHWWRPGMPAHVEVMRSLHVPPQGTWRAYFWDPRKKRFGLHGARFRLYRIKNTGPA